MAGTAEGGSRRAGFNLWLLRAELAAAGVFLCVIVVALVGHLSSRQIFGTGLYWSGEVSRFAFVWCACLGAAAAMELRALHSFDFLVDQLPPALQRVVAVVVIVLIVACLLYLLHYGVEMTERVHRQRSSTLRIPMSYVYAALPVMAALMLVSVLTNLRAYLRRGRASTHAV